MSRNVELRPWHVDVNEKKDTVSVWWTDDTGMNWPICHLFLGAGEPLALATANLIAAAPAYAKAWALVPDEIKQRIFDALYKPDTEWVEASIVKAEKGVAA